VESVDTICRNCISALNRVGRDIKVVITDEVSIEDSVNVHLTKQERNTLQKILDWLKSNIDELEFDGIEIGFPSGIKVKFKKPKII
jgi:hypothetical protein